MSIVRTSLLSIALLAVCGCTTLAPSWLPGTASPASQSTLPQPPASREEPKPAPQPEPGRPDGRAMAGYVHELAKGVELEQARKYAEARKHYEQLIRQWPARYEAYQRLGQVCDRQKRFLEAQENYQRAILLAEGREPDLFNDLGYSFFLQGKLEKAESALRKAVAMRPTEPKYHDNLGLIYGHQRRFEDAWNEFRLAAGEADAFYNLAFIKASLNDFEGAKACFRRALAIDPAHERARRALRAFELAETDPDSLAQLETSNGDTQWVPFVENGQNQDPAAAMGGTDAGDKNSGDRSGTAGSSSSPTNSSRNARSNRGG
jgi:Flp pilus assembly protein TadD